MAALPDEASQAFAGVGNPHRIGPIPPGATVLDVGCGAGMDLLLALRRAGPAGPVIGVDMTPAISSGPNARLSELASGNGSTSGAEPPRTCR